MKISHKFFLGLSLTGLLTLLVFGVFGPSGFRDFLALKEVEASWLEENRRLEAENRDMARQIERLRYDAAYIEHIARKELGMIGREEIILRIDPAGKETPQK